MIGDPECVTEIAFDYTVIDVLRHEDMTVGMTRVCEGNAVPYPQPGTEFLDDPGTV